MLSPGKCYARHVHRHASVISRGTWRLEGRATLGRRALQNARRKCVVTSRQTRWLRASACRSCKEEEEEEVVVVVEEEEEEKE